MLDRQLPLGYQPSPVQQQGHVETLAPVPTSQNAPTIAAKTDVAVRAEAQQGLTCVRDLEVALARTPASTSRAADAALAVAIAAPSALGFLTATLGTTATFVLGTDPAWGIATMTCGIAGAALSRALGPLCKERVSNAGARKRAVALEHAQASDFATVRKAAAAARGPARALFVCRAETALEGFELSATPAPARRAILGKNHLDNTPVIDLLRSLAAMRSECSEGDLAETQLMERVLADVFRPGSLISMSAGELQDSIPQRVERLCSSLEALQPDSRDLVRPLIANVVLAQLEEPQQRFRAQRFSEALDGKRTPWCDDEVPVELVRGAQLADLQSAKADPKSRAVRSLERSVVEQVDAGHAVDSTATLPDGPSAKAVAAHFEKLGYRASLVGADGDAIEVTVFDPKSPNGPRIARQPSYSTSYAGPM